MPESRKASKRAAVVASDEDRIGALPDDVLQLLLSLLPSDEAVRTCVLARRWRHLWKSTPALRITRCGGGDNTGDWSAWKLNNFVNHLLLLRGGSPANECVISCDRFGYSEDKELQRFVNLWIRYALSSCQARVLKVSIRSERRRVRIADVPLISQLLKRLELTDVTVKDRALEFSGCPVLEDLNISSCIIYGSKIMSQSLRQLSITGCDFHPKIRSHISTPCLSSLQLTVSSGRAPFLENMPQLVTAIVRLEYMCWDTCDNSYYYGDCGDDTCEGCHDSNDGSCVLLKGLSCATDLELTSYPDVFIFRKDVIFYPKFCKLKTLVLNGWCVADDFGAVVYFLRQSTILEKLTLQLENYEKQYPMVRKDERYIPAEKFSVSKQLKLVEIKCRKENVLVERLLLILRAYGVPSEKINIKQNLLPSETSSLPPPSIC